MTKDGAYIIHLDEYANLGIHQVTLLYKQDEIVYFNSFGVEYIPEEIKEFIKEFHGNKTTKTNILRVQEDTSIICGYFCIGYIDFTLAGKKLTDYANLFSPYDFKKYDHIILSYFKNE